MLHGVIGSAPIGGLVATVATSTSSPTIPATVNSNVLQRVPSEDDRLRRFSEILASIVNSLIAKGFLSLVDASEWTLHGEGITAEQIASLFNPGAHEFWGGPGPAFRVIAADDLPSGLASGSGTAGKIAKWSSASILTDSLVSESGSTILISAFPSSPWGVGTSKNERFGANSGRNAATGDSNLALGPLTLNACTTGIKNIAVGDSALMALTTASSCIGIGFAALLSLTTGDSNLGVGGNSLQVCTTGSGNTAIGVNSLSALTVGNENLAVGGSTLALLTTGAANIAIGVTTGNTLTTGTGNTLIGKSADVASSGLNFSVAIGFAAIAFASQECAFGPLINIQTGYGSSSTSVRPRADFTDSWVVATDATRKARRVFHVWDTAAREVFQADATGTTATLKITATPSAPWGGAGSERFGESTGNDFATGVGNIAFGNHALEAVTSGYENVAIGQYTLYLLATGVQNMALGHGALFVTTGSGNTGIGYRALFNCTSGNYNMSAGFSTGVTLVTGNNNTLLGAFSNVAAAGQEYGVAIGFAAVAAANETAFSPYSNVQTGYGVSSTAAIRPRADFTDSWVVATDASRTARRVFNVWDTAQREAFRIEASGSVATIGFLGSPAAGIQTGDAGTALVTFGLMSGTPTFAVANVVGASFSLFDHFADAGNVGTGEDDLYSDTIVAGRLATNGDKIVAQYSLAFVSSATATRQVRVYFGGTLVLDTGALTFGSAGVADVWITVIRESSSVVRCIAEFVASGLTLQPLAQYTRITGLTLANTQVLKITGEAAGVGAATDDLVAKLGYVEFKPHA